ncbi:hypothetical protein HDU85_002081 [Gaertneriomyces sp. JEL0708]|nr:hypothetical protein HDU85_002081 [Gaertneriomyces sp. JEL0708]
MEGNVPRYHADSTYLAGQAPDQAYTLENGPSLTDKVIGTHQTANTASPRFASSEERLRQDLLSVSEASLPKLPVSEQQQMSLQEDEVSILGASQRQKDGGHSKSPLSSGQRCESGTVLKDKSTIVMLSGPARSPAISVREVHGFFRVPVSVVKVMVAGEIKSHSSRIYVKFGTPDDAQRAFHAVADSRYSPHYADVSTLNTEFLRPDQVLSVLHVSNFPRTPTLEDVKRILPPGANIHDIHILGDNSTRCHVWVSVSDIDTAKACFIRLSGQLFGDQFLTVSFVSERGNIPDHHRPLENGLYVDSSTSLAEQTMSGKQDSAQTPTNIDFLGGSDKTALPEGMTASKTTPSTSIYDNTGNTPDVHQQEIGYSETTQLLDPEGDCGDFRQQQKRKRGEVGVNSRQRKRIDNYDSDWNTRSQGTWYSPADPQAANESFANEFVIPAKLRNIPAIQPPPPPEEADLTWSEPAQSSSVPSTAAFETLQGGQVDLASSNHIHPDRISRITLDKQAANRIIMNQINGNGRQTQGTKTATRWPTPRQDGDPEDGEIAEDSVVLAKARQEKPRQTAEHATSASNGDAMDVDKTSHRGNSVAAGVHAWGPIWQGQLRLTGEKQQPRLFQCAFVAKGSSRPWTTIPSSLSCIMDDPSASIHRLSEVVKDPRAEFLLLKEKSGVICTSFIRENSLLKVGKICVDEDRAIYLVPLFALGQLPPGFAADMRNIRKPRLYKHLLAVYLDKKAPHRTSNGEGWEIKQQYAQLDWKDFFKRKDQTSEATATPVPESVEPPTPDSSIPKDINDELTSQPVPIPAPACQILDEEKVNALPSMDKIYYAVEVEGEGPKSRKYLSFPGLRKDLINYALKCFVKEEDADGEVMFIPVNKWLEWHTTLSAFREAPAPATSQMTRHVPVSQQTAFMQAALGYPGSAFMVLPVHPGFASGLSASGINGIPFTGWSHGAAGMHTAEIGSYGAEVAGYATRRPRENRTFDATSAQRVTETSTDRPPIPHADKTLLEQAQWLEEQAAVMRCRMGRLNMKKATGTDSC